MSRGGRRRNAPPKRRVRAPRPHPSELVPNPASPLPPGTVMLVCGPTGNPLSDVLEADWPEGWYWPNGRWYQTGDRYAFSLNSPLCDHDHEIPTQEEIAAKVAEAKEAHTVIWHRVNVKR
jgi:hypothetical protein